MSIVTVTRKWDDRMGPCCDCGDPAAFVCPDIYRRADGSNADKPVDGNNVFCAICAVQHACDGERVFRLFVEDDDPEPTDEHARYLRELGIEWPC